MPCSYVETRYAFVLRGFLRFTQRSQQQLIVLSLRSTHRVDECSHMRAVAALITASHAPTATCTAHTVRRTTTWLPFLRISRSLSNPAPTHA
jgi:hypothetical protein